VFLKTLAIRGFKSFADRAALDFEPGITVVVGPNGSGKSNVVDAIAWVLGAQAPSAVRSQRMDDVIFAGTSKRPALGRAEVSLTIDNTSGYLPVGFTEVTVRRTLFRSGESEYAINNVPCRLLEIQDLLSDAGVGRQQHVIASQGQLDAILNARPEERRAIIEEAAGVLKHRKRRERSERRLAATEANLTRVNDLLREVRRQMRPLERQAQAARRAAEIQVEVRALRLHLAGRELTALEGRLAAAQDRQTSLGESSSQVHQQLADLDARVAAAEDELRSQETRALTASIARADTLRERARGQAAVLAERARAVERELAQADDRSAMVVLDAELERAHQEEKAELVEAEVLTAEQHELAAADEVLAAESAALKPLPEAGRAPDGKPGTAGAAADLSELRRELSGVQAASEQRQAELRRLATRYDQMATRVQRLDGEAARLASGEDGSDEAEDALARAAAQADAARQQADARLATAEAERRDAEAEQRAWHARAEALEQALEQVRARAGAKRLSGRAGVLGTLLDVVEVDPGWEAAVEAAAGEALSAVVVAGASSARQALEALREAGQSGAVLPARAGRSGDGAVSTDTGTSPPVGEWVAAHVRARDSLPAESREAVAHLLVVVVGAAARVDGDWSEVVDAAVSHPGLVVVSEEGDRFAPTGGWLGAARARATDALAQEARQRAEETAARQRAAVDEHQSARTAAEQARRQHQQSVRAADEHAGRRRATDAARQRLASELVDARRELAELAEQRDGLDAALTDARLRSSRLAARLPDLEAAAAEADAQTRAHAEAVAVLERRAAALARRRAQLDVRASLATDRRGKLQARRNALRASLEEASVASLERESRKSGLVERSGIVECLAAVVRDRLGLLEATLIELQGERDRRSEASRQKVRALDELRRQRAAAAGSAAELAEFTQRCALEITELSVRLDSARETARRDLEIEPCEATVPTEMEPPTLPPGVDAASRLQELERELRQLGPVNPLAMEEHAALVGRHDFLEAQLADVKASRRELARVIRAIDDEISATFAAAFADVATHFSQLFGTLFPGGSGELRLTDPDNLLDTGVEVEARPSGKNVRKLSLLSGGERSLTALGLLFAIFRSRPSPFYVLDEVEAALDDVNLRRFLGLLEEFRSEAQLIVVSHQKRTMEVADCLYGVTIQPGQSSKVVSERLRATG
jgi:chromosome segregation protein